jgi:uncharacterized membrane protein
MNVSTVARRLRLGWVWDSLREGLWFIPAIALVVSVLVAEMARIFDGRLAAPSWFETDAESAQALLGAIATATLTLTGLVFSITMLVLQLASSQLSPRVMRRFLRDRNNQVVLGLFISTFAYALLALRNVKADSVPSFSVWLGFMMAMISVVAFVHYMDHMAKSIRTSSVISGIGDETRATIERSYPDPIPIEGDAGMPDWAEHPELQVTWEGRAGVLAHVDLEHLEKIARRRSARVVVLRMVGDFVPHGSALFGVQGQLLAEDITELRMAAAVGDERTMMSDVGFGLRQLVDIGERALSPGVNDPTTAVQALDQIHDVLRCLATRALGPELGRTEGGDVSVAVPRPDWETFVGIGADELRRSGRESLQTNRRLRHLLEDLLTVAPPARQTPLRTQLALLDEALPSAFPLAYDRNLASRASPRGH